MYINCMRVCSLNEEERLLCRLVREAGIVNHFAEERLVLDRKISNLPEHVSREQLVSEVISRVAGFVAKMEEEMRASVAFYEGEDRELVFYTFLFDIFHRTIEVFDRHILSQIAAGDAAIDVSFASEVLTLFMLRGFTESDAILFFAIFFQLRRAFFFIVKQLVGVSPCMQKLRTDLWCTIFTCDPVFYKENLLGRMEDFSTLILGQTGTGKGTAASAIGRSGFIPFDAKTGKFAESFTRAFVSLNLSQFPEGIIESELFGHKKGAFTGAFETQKGVFDICSSHGSIFLDEIGDISVPVQIKLLRVLQERLFSPVGSHEKRRFSGRVIAATNKDIDSLRRQGVFRDDFYYRLCSDVIVMPPLFQRIREDGNELDKLVAHLVAVITGAENQELAAVVRTVIDERLGQSYPWPGNVRELEQCVRRVIIRREYHGDLRPQEQSAVGALVEKMDGGELSAESLLSTYARILYKRYNSYEAVSRVLQVDRRTAKRHVHAGDH